MDRKAVNKHLQDTLIFLQHSQDDAPPDSPRTLRRDFLPPVGLTNVIPQRLDDL
jgi:hypothetical protein